MALYLRDEETEAGGDFRTSPRSQLANGCARIGMDVSTSKSLPSCCHGRICCKGMKLVCHCIAEIIEGKLWDTPSSSKHLA